MQLKNSSKEKNALLHAILSFDVFSNTSSQNRVDKKKKKQKL